MSVVGDPLISALFRDELTVDRDAIFCRPETTEPQRPHLLYGDRVAIEHYRLFGLELEVEVGREVQRTVDLERPIRRTQLRTSYHRVAKILHRPTVNLKIDLHSRKSLRGFVAGGGVAVLLPTANRLLILWCRGQESNLHASRR